MFGVLTMVISKVKWMQLNYTGVFTLFMSLFYLSLILDYRAFIWKTRFVFWMLSKCDKAGETTGAEIQVLVSLRCECSKDFAAIKGRSVGKHK